VAGEAAGDAPAYRRSSDVVVRRVAGETLLVPTGGELARLQRIFVLDEVGEVVWELLDGRRGLADIVRSVTGVFEIDANQARSDIAEFLSTLAESGLVEEAGADGAAIPARHR
jgi:hypothetical protein